MPDRPRVAVVTGAAGGIGRLICQSLRREGTVVVGADLEIDDSPPGVVPCPCDVRSTAAVTALFDHAGHHGRLTAVVAAHGVIRPTPLDAFSDDDFQLMVDVNLGGVMRVCTAAADHLTAGGAVVNMSSVVASRGGAPDTVAYAASKAAIESVTRHYAVGLAARGVRVNAVAPGFVDTSMAGPAAQIRKRLGDDPSSITAQIPLGRMVRQQEVVDAVLFLLSERASAVTGVVVPVDGGLLAT